MDVSGVRASAEIISAAAKRQMRVVIRSRLTRAYDSVVIGRVMTNLL